MAVAHVASATTNTTTGTTTDTITIPASVVAGHDLYVLALSVGVATVTCTDDDAGGNVWAVVSTSPEGTIWLFWKKATSGTASKTVTLAGAVDSLTGGLSVFSGALASGDPTTDLVWESNASGNEAHAGFTPTVAGSMISFAVLHFNPPDVVTLLACTDPGSLEPELWERSSTGGTDAYAIFTARSQVGGPTATGNFTWAMTNAATRSLAFAIQPAVAVGGAGHTNRLLLGVG